MTQRFWLLGSRQGLDATGLVVSELLGLALHEHESGYRGGAYLRGSGKAIEEVIVQANFRDEDGEFAEPDFAEFETLVYITEELATTGSVITFNDQRVNVLTIDDV